jgi:hypothetical protein
MNDVEVDTARANSKDAPWFCDYVDIAAPIILTLLGWPADQTSNHKTVAPFTGTFPTGTDSDLLPFMIFTSLIPPCVSILFKFLGDPDAKSRTDKDSWAGYYMPFILTIAGAANTILSSIYAWGTTQDDNVKAEGILGNLSYVYAMLGTPEMVDSSEEASLGVLLVIDTLGNLSAGLCMALDGGNALPS